ncbi:MAG: hypothetical protein ACLQG5_07640 [Methanobacterium sp.]
MKINKPQFESLVWIIPAIIAFCLILIPTLKYSWPLSWDVIANVQTAQVYAKYGLVFINPLLNAPYGQVMDYPPLFYFLIVALGDISKINFFQVTRFLQPFLGMFVVLSVSYVGRKFYGTIAGISAGFLILSSLLLGNRLIFAVPENLALIFLPLSVYFYYFSLKEKSFIYAVLAGFLFILIILIHPAAPIVLFSIISAVTIVELFFYRNIRVFKNYIAFLLLPVLLFVIGLVGLFVIFPHNFYNILIQSIHEAVLYSIFPYNLPIGLSSYGNLGILTLVFGLAGVIASIIRRQKKDIFIITWIIVVILLINAHLFGVNVYSYRLLIYLLIPVSILGGFGLSQIYYKLKNYKHFSSKNFRNAFLISIFLLATLDGVLTVENPLISSFEINNQFGAFQIAPPSPSEVDLANWFNINGDKSKSILSNDLFPLIFVTTQTGMPLDSDLDFANFNSQSSESYFVKRDVGYVVLDKRLSFPSNNGTLYRIFYTGEVYGLFYYSGNIDSNINVIFPSWVKVVYENKEFIVGEVQ